MRGVGGWIAREGAGDLLRGAWGATEVATLGLSLFRPEGAMQLSAQGNALGKKETICCALKGQRS